MRKVLILAALLAAACRFATIGPLPDGTRAPSRAFTVAAASPTAGLPPIPSLAPVPTGSTRAVRQDSLRSYLLYPDLVYCTGGEQQLKLDFYSSREPTPRARPLVMFVHGGSWMHGDKSQGGEQFEAVELLRRGYAFVSVNYRLAPEYHFPAMIEDVKCAVRYLRAHAAELGIDANRIGAYGSSAGGHLVSLLGTADVSAGFEGTGGWGDQSSRVEAVANLYGPTDFNQLTSQRDRLGLSLVFPGNEDSLRRASPITYVSPDDPPFLILQGELDDLVPVSQAVEFDRALRQAGVPSTLVLVHNAGHGFSPVGGKISPSRTELFQILVAFFDEHLR
jgi:acetyl esterase/lipase